MVEVQQDERVALRTAVRAFLERHYGASDVRTQMEDSRGYDPETWRRMAQELGLPGLLVPEQYGGSGVGFVEMGIVLEEAGRALLGGPLFPTAVLAVTCLLACDDDSLKSQHLQRISAGELLVAVAVPGMGDGAFLQASLEGGAWKLSGRAFNVIEAQIADVLLVFADTDDGVALFAVDLPCPGVTVTGLRTTDQTRRQAHLDVAGVPARLMVSSARTPALLETLAAASAVGLACEQVGGAEAAMRMAVEYAGIRVQFGRVIGSFQAIKHHCADMLLAVESAKASARRAAVALASDDPDLAVIASIAKARCSEAYSEVAACNIQVHGGIGFTWEHSAHLHLKRAKTSELLFGGPIQHRERLATLLGIHTS